jgi:hypothetical protein
MEKQPHDEYRKGQLLKDSNNQYYVSNGQELGPIPLDHYLGEEVIVTIDYAEDK